MNNEEIRKKEEIESALAAMIDGDFLKTSKDLLAALGYHSERTAELSGTAEDFIQKFQARNRNTKTEEEFCYNAKSVELVFQVTSDEIDSSDQLTLFDAPSFDKGYVRSFLFFTVELEDKNYPRGKYAQFTREINKRFMMPIVVFFHAKDRLTIGFVSRRQHKQDPDRDVLEQVTLIKDIRLNDPHRAHLDILFELSLAECAKWMASKKQPENFDGLLAAWLARLDTEELNKQFYRKLFDWFEWAVKKARFPKDKNRTLKAEEHIIRLITRLLFVWFIKEKGLVAGELFNEAQIRDLLKNYNRDTGDSYYRVVLQNLFFATLNTKIGERRFSEGTRNDHRNFSLYRYKDQMLNPDRLLDLFSQTPFINGGLFDCLDNFKGRKKGGYRIDCFSDEHYTKLSIPNLLFFDKTRGLISLLEHYKFTVEENTPVEQDVALDPELLGNVFENLLAAYNPETGKTVRKQTGSYYTPRAIVDYMVEEALVTTLSQQVSPAEGDTELWKDQLRYLLDYAQVCDDASEWFDDDETDRIVRAISELKILDPAVGSGAFPMGVLHKLTLALRRLDPDNTLWEQLQQDRAGKRAQTAFKISNQQTRDVELAEISETFERYRDSDFGRKLYLIQNSIFGVDIQPVACQVAKLRFFISLAIEQETTQEADNNFGIKPLPNLETRFVVANTLVDLQLSETLPLLQDDVVQHLLREIEGTREKHFLTNNRQEKLDLEEREEEHREHLKRELESQREKWVENQQRVIERKITQLSSSELREQLREVEQKEYEGRKKKFDFSFEDARKIAGWKPYDQNARADWFDPEWMFGITDGFDVVIGNPPYGAKINQDDLNRIKANAQNTKNSNSAALFIDYAKNRLIQTNRQGGIVAFIVPKSLLFSEKWHELAFSLLEKTAILVDVEKAFEKVKLEQVVFIYSPQCESCFYVGRKFLNSAFVRTTHIDRKYPKQFQSWICDVSSDDIELGVKIANIGTYLRDISKTTRGLSIQKNLSTRGDIEVIGGKEVSRYGIVGIKGFVNREDLDLTSQKIQHLLHPKVISQRLVAHIQNPKPHIKITSTVDETGDVLSVDTVENTIIENENFSPIFISSLFNSTLINWYAYRFIFCCAIRTMDFDNYYVGKIPVPAVTFEQQAPIIELFNQILDAKRTDPDADVSDLENEIDQIVYLLYDLTREEIAIVEGTENV